MRTPQKNAVLPASFVTTHFVDADYHKLHPQLIHRHPTDLELLYILEGEGKYFVSNREYSVRKGNLIICNANTLHGEPPQKDNQMISFCCVLSDLALEGAPPNTIPNSLNNPIVYFDEDTAVIESLCTALLECESLSQDSTLLKQFLANAFLETVLQKLKQRSPKNENSLRKNDRFMQAIMDYLDNHYEENISLQDLEDVFKVSRYTISHIFKSESGISPMKYVLQRKIGEAQSMLMNTQTPIGDISDRLGFNNNCHFSSCFKKYVGVTPTDYRIRFTELLKAENNI